MSRKYGLWMRVWNVLTSEDVDAICVIIDDQEEPLEFDCDNNVVIAKGETHLCGGESELEAHNRISSAIKEVFPTVKVQTEWTNLEELPFEIYGDDEDDN